ncbi:hypothetical protein AALF15_12255 [Corynebacteriaceae bacterium 7-707]
MGLSLYDFEDCTCCINGDKCCGFHECEACVDEDARLGALADEARYEAAIAEHEHRLAQQQPGY